MSSEFLLADMENITQCTNTPRPARMHSHPDSLPNTCLLEAEGAEVMSQHAQNTTKGRKEADNFSTMTKLVQTTLFL